MLYEGAGLPKVERCVADAGGDHGIPREREAGTGGHVVAGHVLDNGRGVVGVRDDPVT